MTLPQVRQYLEWAQNRHVKFLGGEPTMNPHFSTIVDHMIYSNREFTLISNFLFGWSTMKLLQGASKDCSIGYLVNATELDVGNRLKIWKQNYNGLKDTAADIVCGLTVQPGDNPTEYVRWLMTHVDIKKLRVSIDMGGESPIGNVQLGDAITELVGAMSEVGIPVDIDCVMYPCMFKTLPLMGFVGAKELNIPMFRPKCPSPAVDVFPDNTMKYCYPVKDIKLSIDSDSTIEWHVDQLNRLYRIGINNRETPNICKDCEYYEYICEGPCLATRV
jgi:hypothetical protein